jgi:transcription elongation factor Elf1
MHRAHSYVKLYWNCEVCGKENRILVDSFHDEHRYAATCYACRNENMVAVPWNKKDE